MPKDHILKELPCSEWTNGMLEALLDLAKKSPVHGLRYQARQRAFMVIGEAMTRNGQLIVKSTQIEAALRKANRTFISAWPPMMPNELPQKRLGVSTSSNSVKGNNTPTQDAVEDFGAWLQPTVDDQSAADRLVLEMYVNALSRGGAAFGKPDEGPTICSVTLAGRTIDRINPKKSEGPLFCTPSQLDSHHIVNGGYGNVRHKRHLMIMIESHFGLTLGDFFKMALRPENAFYLPEALLAGLAQIMTEFQHIPYKTLFGHLLDECKANRRSRCLNTRNIQNVIKLLQRDYQIGNAIRYKTPLGAQDASLFVADDDDAAAEYVQGNSHAASTRPTPVNQDLINKLFPPDEDDNNQSYEVKDLDEFVRLLGGDTYDTQLHRDWRTPFPVFEDHQAQSDYSKRGHSATPTTPPRKSRRR